MRLSRGAPPPFSLSLSRPRWPMFDPISGTRPPPKGGAAPLPPASDRRCPASARGRGRAARRHLPPFGSPRVITSQVRILRRRGICSTCSPTSSSPNKLRQAQVFPMEAPPRPRSSACRHPLPPFAHRGRSPLQVCIPRRRATSASGSPAAAAPRPSSQNKLQLKQASPGLSHASAPCPRPRDRVHAACPSPLG